MHRPGIRRVGEGKRSFGIARARKLIPPADTRQISAASIAKNPESQPKPRE